jgi:hypothetical protein
MLSLPSHGDFGRDCPYLHPLSAVQMRAVSQLEQKSHRQSVHAERWLKCQVKPGGKRAMSDALSYPFGESATPLLGHTIGDLRCGRPALGTVRR